LKVTEISPNDNVCCPICNQIIMTNDGESGPEECPHTLLIATDYGIEFCSDALEQELLEEKAEDSSWDEAISEIVNPNAILLKMYQGAPSFFGSYFLFAG
jgi:hypothetical protein